MDLFHIFVLPDVWREIEEEDDRRAARLLLNQRRVLREVQNPLEWPNSLFKKTFRLTKDVFIQLRNELAEIVGPQFPTRRALTFEQKILVTLQFYATGSYQRITGAASHMAQPTTSHCINEVTDLLNSPVMLNRWIRYPMTPAELAEVRRGFFDKFQFPGVIGVIDGSFVSIVRPSEHEDQYFNRKGYHSLNIMIICDCNGKILAVNASFGGASNDSHVWNMSAVNRHVQRVSNGVMWLIGDSGYAQRAWIMTPFFRPAPGSREAHFNEKLTTTRCTIERCLGVLKSRWRCLLRARVLHYKPTTCSKIVNASAVLHNMMMDEEIDFDIEDIEEDRDPIPEQGPADPNVNQLNLGRAIRNRVVDMLHQ